MSDFDTVTPKNHDLVLDKYERDNLACLFAALERGGYRGSGDWFHQILYKLCTSSAHGTAVTPPRDATPNRTVEGELELLRIALK